MVKRNEAVVAVAASSQHPSSFFSSLLPISSSMNNSNHHQHLPPALYQHLLFTLLVILAISSITITPTPVSALSVPSGLAKFDKCANSTYACLTGSHEDGKFNYTVAYCCCYDLWNNCMRTLNCNLNGNGGGNLAAPSSANHPKKMKGSQESCNYLRNQNTKMKNEKICPAKLTNCPSGAPPSSLVNAATSWTVVTALLFLFTLNRIY